MKAKNTRVLMIGALAALAIAAGACTPPASGGGGGGGGTGPLNTGCFETLWGPDAGRARITVYQHVGNLWVYQWWSHGPGDSNCSGSATSGPTNIWAGEPGPEDDEYCQAVHGPEAYATDQLSNWIVPHQDFWSCNYPL